jgi:hypothetical protein
MNLAPDRLDLAAAARGAGGSFGHPACEEQRWVPLIASCPARPGS